MATTRKLIVEIAEAHNLFPKDGTGMSSPYARVDFDGQRRKTHTVTRNLNPVWNEVLEFNLSGTGGRTVLGEPLEVSVFHDVRVGPSRRNCFLGRVRLDSRHFVKKGEEALMYFPLEKKSFFGRVRGEIGLKVYYVEEPVPEAVPVPEPALAPPQELNGTDTPAAEATQGEETLAAAPAPTEAEAASAAAAPPPESAAKPTDVPESALPPAEQPADETRGTENAEADIVDQPAVGSAADLNPPPPEQEKVATPQWVPPPRQVPRRQETAPELGATAPPKYDGNISFQGDGVGGSMASAKIGNSVSDGTSSSLAVPKSTKPGFRMSVSEDFLDDDEEEPNEKAETTVPVKNDFHKVEFGTSKQGKESKLPEQKGTAPSEAEAAPTATAKPDNNVLSSLPAGETSGKPTESASFSASPSLATEAPVKPVFAFRGSSSPKFSFSAVPATTPITQTAFTSSTTASVMSGANVPSPAPEAPKFSFVQFGASNASSSQTLPSPSLDDLGAKASDTNAVKPVTFGSSPNVSASSATATEIQNAAALPAGTLTTATTSTGLFSSNVTGHLNSGITNTPTFTFGTSEKSTTPSVPTFAFAFAFGNSAMTATVTTSSPSVAPTPVSTSTSMTTPGVTFGGSGTTCAFTFGASSQPSSSRSQSAPFTFGATSTNTSTGNFGFGASSSQNAGSSTSTPSSGSSQPFFAFGASTGSIFGSKPVQPESTGTQLNLLQSQSTGSQSSSPFSSAAASPAIFGASSSGFSFSSSVSTSSTSASTSQPSLFGSGSSNSPSIFGTTTFGSNPYGATFTFGQSSSTPSTSFTFGAQPSSAGFSFLFTTSGSNSTGPAVPAFGQAASPLPAPAFQFGAPLFQPGSSLEFNVGSQVSESGAGDKANRRIVKVRRDKTRRK